MQIELSRKIQVQSCYSMKLSSLQVDRKYPITHAERVATRFGPANVLAIRDTPDRILSSSIEDFILPFRMNAMKK